MPLLNHTNIRAQEASEAAVVGTLGAGRIGNTTHGAAVYLTGTEQPIDVALPSYSFQLVTADTLVKDGAGVLHTVTLSCNDAAPTAGSVIIYDNTAESGTQIFNHTFTTTPFVPLTLTFDAAFAAGLYVGFTTTADVNVTVTYR